MEYHMPRLTKILWSLGLTMILLVAYYVQISGISYSSNRNLAASLNTFTVNSITDATDANPGDGNCATSGGLCTLRAAIQETNALANVDTIIIPAGTYQLTISGTGEDESVTGDLDITDSLIVTGATTGTTIVNGGALDHVFHVRTSQAVTFTRVTIQNGNAPYTNGMLDGGGGIRATNGANLTIINCNIINNYSASRGGGIFSIANVLNIVNSQISHNTSQSSGGGFSSALFDAIINITGSVFTSNHTNASAGGGNFLGDEVTMLDTQFINNVATGWGGAAYFSRQAGNVYLDSVTMSGNTSGGYGGAVVVSGTDMILSINNSQISNNRASLGGGAIYYNYPNGTESTITATGFTENKTENTATTSGGAILVTGDNINMGLNNAHFLQNMSSVYAGGAVANFADNSTFAITNTTFISNTANTTGGAFWSNGDNVVSSVTGSAFTGNSSLLNGGAIYMQGLTNTVTIAGSYFDQNHSDFYGGAIRFYGPGPTFTTIGVTAYITGTTFTANSALIGGGALASGTGTSTVITNTAFTYNDTNGDGGAIHSSSDGMVGMAHGHITNSTFSGNQAASSGGAIYAFTSSTEVRLRNVTIAFNTADNDNDGNGNGGGVELDNNGILILSNSLIANNIDSGNEAPDCYANGTFFSSTNNLIGKTDGCVFTPNSSDLVGTIANPLEPLLDPLVGSPAYHPLGIGSPAIDNGNPSPPLSNPYALNCHTADQNGTLRPLDGNGDNLAICDIGAIEAPQRISVTLNPSIGNTLTYTDTQGNPTIIEIPIGAVTETTTLLFTPIQTITPPPTWLFANHAFDLDAYVDNVLQPGFNFLRPVTVTITYAESDITSINEISLVLHYWDNGQWLDAACSIYERDSNANQLMVPICHLSRFALLGRPNVGSVYLPLINR